MAEQRVSDEQLTEWERESELFMVNSDPTGRLSWQVRELIADLRASRAETAELIQAFRDLSADHAEWQRIANKVAGQRDGLQQRIDNALGRCDWIARMGYGSASDYDKGGQRAAWDIRAALTGTKPGEAVPR